MTRFLDSLFLVTFVLIVIIKEKNDTNQNQIENGYRNQRRVNTTKIVT